jgi:hypothetical protein
MRGARILIAEEVLREDLVDDRDPGRARGVAVREIAPRHLGNAQGLEEAGVRHNMMVEINEAVKLKDGAKLVKLADKRIVIVETKGLEDLDVPLKMERLRQWCEDINRLQTNVTYDFIYVDEESFEKYKPTSFRQLVDGFREYKEKI